MPFTRKWKGMGRSDSDKIEWDVNKKASESILELIGRTPLVKLERISKKNGVSADIFGKLEFYNPTGSLKDRIYYGMLKKAIESGELRPGMEIIEASTGNAGISCSFIGHLLGYKVIIVMPKGMSQERVKMILLIRGQCDIHRRWRKRCGFGYGKNKEDNRSRSW